MDRTNAERQRRYRERLKAAARGGGDGSLLARLQTAYAEAAQREARRFLENARAKGSLDLCGPELAARGEMELETWVEVFRKEPDEDVIVSIVEAAGTRAGWQLPAENLFNLLALSKEREAEATPETPSPRRRRRRANP